MLRKHGCLMRRECEQYGMAASNRLDFNTPEEAAEVEQIFNNAIQCLSEEDRALGPVIRMLPMLKKVWRIGSMSIPALSIIFEPRTRLDGGSCASCHRASECITRGYCQY
jgi:hypothetical protein